MLWMLPELAAHPTTMQDRFLLGSSGRLTRKPCRSSPCPNKKLQLVTNAQSASHLSKALQSHCHAPSRAVPHTFTQAALVHGWNATPPALSAAAISRILSLP